MSIRVDISYHWLESWDKNHYICHNPIFDHFILIIIIILFTEKNKKNDDGKIIIIMMEKQVKWNKEWIKIWVKGKMIGSFGV